MPPELIEDRYELVREIGRGASATVYLAHDRTLGRDIALKLVVPALANDPSFVDRFMREARLSASLQHPHIVTVHDVGETEDHRPFLAMAFIDGVSLEKVIEKSAPLPVGEASRILSELASALDYLHARGLIHRDVKPSNVLIEESGRVMLSDFGVAYARESSRYTMTGVLLGTPRYMAPEQMLGEEPTAQTDVYAMGVVAFEMLAGAPPFEGTGTGLMYKIVHEPPPLIRAHSPNIPAGIEEAIARALAKDPAARWASPGEFAAAFASPEANATLMGAISPAASAPRPPAPAVGDFPDDPGDTPPVVASIGSESAQMRTEAGDGSGRGRRGVLLGAGGLGLVGLTAVAIAGYCLAAGGVNPELDDSEERTYTATARPSSSGASTSSTATATATQSPAPTSTVATGATVVPAATVATQPSGTSPALATNTSTSTAGPSASSTAASTATPSPSPSATSTATPTPTSTPSPTLAPPNPPSNVALSGNTLSWNDNSNNETGFRIYWRTTGLNDGVIHVTSDKTVGPNTTSTAVATINYTFDQTDFRRGVSAYNSAGESTIVWHK